jgi:ABC-type phosphate transport system permease subunit
MKTQQTDQVWYPSHREEIIAALYLIAGTTAWQAGAPVLAWWCCLKAAADTACAVWFAIQENKEPK